MKKLLALCFIALTFSTASSSVMAQDFDYHPFLSDNFTVFLGAMRSNNSFKMESDVGADIGDEIDFIDTLAVSDHSTLFNGQLK